MSETHTFGADFCIAKLLDIPSICRITVIVLQRQLRSYAFCHFMHKSLEDPSRIIYTGDHKGVPLRSRTGNLDEELAWTKSHGTPINVACHLEQALVWLQSNGHAISPLHPTLKSIVSRNVPSCERIGFGGAGVYSVDCKLYLHATSCMSVCRCLHLTTCIIAKYPTVSSSLSGLWNQMFIIQNPCIICCSYSYGHVFKSFNWLKFRLRNHSFHLFQASESVDLYCAS